MMIELSVLHSIQLVMTAKKKIKERSTVTLVVENSDLIIKAKKRKDLKESESKKEKSLIF